MEISQNTFPESLVYIVKDLKKRVQNKVKIKEIIKDLKFTSH